MISISCSFLPLQLRQWAIAGCDRRGGGLELWFWFGIWTENPSRSAQQMCPSSGRAGGGARVYSMIEVLRSRCADVYVCLRYRRVAVRAYARRRTLYSSPGSLWYLQSWEIAARSCGERNVTACVYVTVYHTANAKQKNKPILYSLKCSW